MKKTLLVLGAVLALSACKQDASTGTDTNDTQLEDVAADVPENSDLTAEGAPESPDGSTPSTATSEAMSEEPLPGVPSTASAAPSAANPLFNLSLQKGQAGAVQIGMTIDELQKKYGQSKLREIEHSIEGTTTKAYEVLGERRRPDLRVEQTCKDGICIVSRITVLNPAFKNQNGVGIGSMFKAVKENFNISSLGQGEGNFVAISEDSRMSFVLDMRGIPSQRWNKLTVKDVPNSTLVAGIMLW